MQIFIFAHLKDIFSANPKTDVTEQKRPKITQVAVPVQPVIPPDTSTAVRTYKFFTNAVVLGASAIMRRVPRNVASPIRQITGNMFFPQQLPSENMRGESRAAKMGKFLDEVVKPKTVVRYKVDSNDENKPDD